MANGSTIVDMLGHQSVLFKYWESCSSFSSPSTLSYIMFHSPFHLWRNGWRRWEKAQPKVLAPTTIGGFLPTGGSACPNKGAAVIRLDCQIWGSINASRVTNRRSPRHQLSGRDVVEVLVLRLLIL